MPVHSLLAILFFASSNADPANAIAVLLKAPAYIRTLSIASFERAVFTAEVEEAVVGPVTGGGEEDEDKNGTVDARAVEEIGADEEEENKDWGGVGGDEEEGEPTMKRES
ncbi:hypothetical protein SBOR_7613 [Sclerotinia borealis F-4128]|uniref:Uncharacterized protein n=1 Tax=Sclerotinia borealis (strain F-4128) TaxID=1432307 RepID=W9C877_SCLBF|nr:hypothetical protein SBOR_7613 [Sclerotinia borealis F-4128]